MQLAVVPALRAIINFAKTLRCKDADIYFVARRFISSNDKSTYYRLSIIIDHCHIYDIDVFLFSLSL